MTATLLIFLFTLLLAYANGANDNFKGVATLFGSRTTSYRVALGWGTITTLAGSLFSIVVAHKLIEVFSGKGLVPATLAQEPSFLLAVAIGAGLTVMIATLTGFPISTTHSLVGALAGAGLAGIGSQVNFGALGQEFLAPLLLSPLAAILLATLLYNVLRAVRRFTGITKEYCLCVGETKRVVAVASDPARFADVVELSLTTSVAEEKICIERYSGTLLGFNVEKILDGLHFLSAGMVSFARGLNDTPKIMGLLLVASFLEVRFSMIFIALAMAVGGLLNARKVAHVMSREITTLNHGQGFTANIVTAMLVIFASKMGMPVSTTHVSVGTLFGIGAVNGRANYRVIGGIVTSWILTLPLAALLAAAAFFVCQGVG